MNNQEKILLLSQFHRACLELDWAKYGRAKTADKRFAAIQKRILTELLGRPPTESEIEAYDKL